MNLQDFVVVTEWSKKRNWPIGWWTARRRCWAARRVLRNIYAVTLIESSIDWMVLIYAPVEVRIDSPTDR